MRPHLRLPKPGGATQLHATLSEWKVELSRQTLPGGPVTVAVENTGSIPHQLEIEGNGIEQRTELIQPGSSATLPAEPDARLIRGLLPGGG